MHPRTGTEALYRPYGPWGEQRYSSLYSFLTTAVKGVRGQPHALAALYLRERPSTHCTGWWVSPKAGLDRCGKSGLHRDSITGPSSPQPFTIPSTLPDPLSNRDNNQITARLNVGVVCGGEEHLSLGLSGLLLFVQQLCALEANNSCSNNKKSVPLNC